jgi:orotidine-5'-phosphate decarboxylase
MKLKPEQIIWSADVDYEQLKMVVDSRALPIGTVIKLDRLFFERFDKNAIDYCQNRDYPVFVDAKIVEIPDKTLAIAETYLKHSPWMLNVMAGICSTGLLRSDNPKKIDALVRFAEACKDAKVKSCAVTVLTSKTEEVCADEFGKTPMEQVLNYVKMLKLAKLTDIVCSPLEAAEIRKHEMYSCLSINTPGVRLPDSDANDQARIMTPTKALANGANRLVIGRNLTDGEGKITERIRRNYARILENLETGA